MRPLFRIVGLFMMLAALLLVVGCVDPPIDLRTRPAVQDETLVTGKPSLPPCWYEIISGETNTQDALNIVKRLSFVDPKSVVETTRDLYENTDNSILWFYSGTPDFGGRLSIHRDRVIWYRVSYPNNLRFGDIVAQVGEPDWVWVGREGGAGTEHIFQFIFEARGLMLESRLYGAGTAKDGKVLLSSDIEIADARYFQPQSLKDYLKNIVGATETQTDQMKEAYQPWPGFGVSIEMRKLY